jgi:hypothetical protein
MNMKKSPFPGMDPYLERHWRDVHTALIGFARTALNSDLPEDLVARVEESVAVESTADDFQPAVRRQLAPDVRVFGIVEDLTKLAEEEGDIALAPYRLSLLDEPITERLIEIIDIRGGERLVTVVEFVSTSHKLGDGMEAFMQKRHELLTGGVNFVEIDLVREGDWRTLINAGGWPAKAVAAYRAVIRVPGTPTDVYLHPFSIRAPLPAIKIPLRVGEKPCNLPLQALVEQAYVDGRYDRTLDYRKSCEPPLDGEDSAWADELLRAAGKR